MKKTKDGVTVTEESQNGILDYHCDVDWDFEALNERLIPYAVGYYEVVDLEGDIYDVGVNK